MSVVLPVRNGAAHLEETLDSLEAQTFQDFELIVVDDGSTDETPDILGGRRERDSRYRILEGTGRDGIVGALNIGVGEARGEWIARSDADDASLPGRLEEQLAFLDRNPDITVLGTDYYRVGPDGRRRRRSPPREHSELRLRLLFGNVWCHASMMMKRSILDSKPYRDWKHAEDYELWARLLSAHRGATLPSPLVVYREHEESIGARHRAAQKKMVARIAARELGRFISGVTPVEAQRLKRVFRRPGCVDDEPSVRRLLEAWVALRDSPDTDASRLEALRRRWIAHHLAALPLSGWRSFVGSETGTGGWSPKLLVRALALRMGKLRDSG